MKRYIRASALRAYAIVKVPSMGYLLAKKPVRNSDIEFQGSYDECSDWLKEKYNEAKAQNKRPVDGWRVPVFIDDYKPNQYLELTYQEDAGRNISVCYALIQRR